ncbi:19801_t:CDS:2, partial [Cetraspora pellucida]
MPYKGKQVAQPITTNPFMIAAQTKQQYRYILMDSEDKINTTNTTSSLNNNYENSKSKLLHLLRKNLKFNQTWLITYSWLSGCNNFKEQLLKWHLDTKDYQKTLKTQLVVQLNIVTSFTKHSYTNNHAKRDFIEAIGKVIEEEICYEIPIVFKHIISNISVNQFVGLIELKDYSTNRIIEELNKFFKVKNLPILTLGHFGSDRASVMLDVPNFIQQFAIRLGQYTKDQNPK